MKLQKLIFETAHASGKSLQIGWNTNALEEMPRTRSLVDLGILSYADFVSIHHYTGQTNPTKELQKQITLMREAMGKTDLPIWNTEGGLGPFTVFNLYKHTPPVQDAQHHLVWAEWYSRYYIASLSGGIKRFFVYIMGAPSFWKSDYHFSNIDGSLSPNLTAMSALAWQIEGTAHVKSLSLPGIGGVEIFEGSGRAVACVVPLPGAKRNIPKESGLQAFDLFGNTLAPGSPVPPRLHYFQTEKSAQALEEMLQK